MYNFNSLLISIHSLPKPPRSYSSAAIVWIYKNNGVPIERIKRLKENEKQTKEK